jgi:1-deoxy-D-xylulose-5-phosphate reductoisomerase
MPSHINRKLTVDDYAQLTFERPDMDRFPCLRLAFDALAQGGDRTCVLNAANEVVNAAFRAGRCGFLRMATVIEQTLERMPYRKECTLEDYFAIDAEARRCAHDLL